MPLFDKSQTEFAYQLKAYIEELKAREKFREMSKESKAALVAWNERVKPVQNANKIFAQHIKGLDTWKKILILQTISHPQPFHCIAIGDPASGKSEVCQAIQPTLTDSKYVWASKMTSAGLTLSRLGEDLLKGELPECHYGTLFLDEFDKTPPSEGMSLLSAMQHGWIGISKATIKVPFCPAKIAVAAMANPLGDYWRSVHPKIIREQLPFRSQALLTRFHLILIVRRPDVKEFQAISMHQLDADMKGMAHNAFAEGDQEMWQQYVYYLRRVKISAWENPKRQQEAISAFTKSAYEQDHKFQLAIPISPRLNDGIERIAMAFAKSDFDTTVKIADTVKALKLTAQTLEPCGLDTDKATKAVLKAAKIDVGVE